MQPSIYRYRIHEHEIVDGSRPIQRRLTAGHPRRGTGSHGHPRGYMVAGLVHEGPQVRVPEVGDLRLLRWARPDEAVDPLVDGAPLEVEAKLNLDPRAESDWSRTAASAHATDLRWRVERITRFSVDADSPAEILECSTETVDSATQYCLLDRTLLGDE